MDQFALMVENLTDYNFKYVRNYSLEDEDSINESLALVESTLLHGSWAMVCSTVVPGPNGL